MSEEKNFYLFPHGTFDGKFSQFMFHKWQSFPMIKFELILTFELCLAILLVRLFITANTISHRNKSEINAFNQISRNKMLTTLAKKRNTQSNGKVNHSASKP